MDSSSINLLAVPQRKRSPKVAIIFLPITLGLVVTAWFLFYAAKSFGRAASQTRAFFFRKWLALFLLAWCVFMPFAVTNDTLNSLLLRVLLREYRIIDGVFTFLDHFRDTTNLDWWFRQTYQGAAFSAMRHQLDWGQLMLPLAVLALMVILSLLYRFIRALNDTIRERL